MPRGKARGAKAKTVTRSEARKRAEAAEAETQRAEASEDSDTLVLENDVHFESHDSHDEEDRREEEEVEDFRANPPDVAANLQLERKAKALLEREAEVEQHEKLLRQIKTKLDKEHEAETSRLRKEAAALRSRQEAFEAKEKKRADEIRRKALEEETEPVVVAERRALPKRQVVEAPSALTLGPNSFAGAAATNSIQQTAACIVAERYLTMGRDIDEVGDLVSKFIDSTKAKETATPATTAAPAAKLAPKEPAADATASEEPVTAAPAKTSRKRVAPPSDDSDEVLSLIHI